MALARAFWAKPVEAHLAKKRVEQQAARATEQNVVHEAAEAGAKEEPWKSRAKPLARQRHQ